MSYKLATAYVDIEARMGRMEAQIGAAGNRLSALLGQVGMAASYLGIGAGIGGLIVSTNSFINSAIQAYDAEARLGAVIKATGQAAGFSAEDILKLASSMQATTQFDDEAITDAASKLLTFKKVVGDTFTEALMLSADLSATGFGSIQGSAVQLGKALEDPVRGIGALRRAGVSFTEQEKATIKSLVETNQLLEAQRIILDGVAGQVGGVAQALAKTPAGQWKRLHNLIGDIGEEFGKRILPYANQFLEVSLRIAKGVLYVFDRAVAVNDALGGWPVKIGIAIVALSQIPTILGTIEDGLAIILKLTEAEAMLSWSSSLAKVPAMLTTIQASFSRLLFGYIKPVSMGFVKMPGLIGKISLAWTALSTAITTGTLFTGWGAILVAIGAVIAGVVILIRHLSKFPRMQQAWAKVLDAAAIIWEKIRNGVNNVLKAIYDLVPLAGKLIPLFFPLVLLFDEDLVGAIARAVEAMAEFGVIGAAIFETLSMHTDFLGRAFLAMITGNVFALQSLKEEFDLISMEALGNAVSAVAALNRLKKLRDRESEFASAASNVGKAGGGMEGLPEAWQRAQEAALAPNDQKRAADALERVEDIGKDELAAMLRIERIIGNAEVAIA